MRLRQTVAMLERSHADMVFEWHNKLARSAMLKSEQADQRSLERMRENEGTQ
jgi:hypothetical protein